MTVSVVIATINRQAHLSRLLWSLCCSTQLPDEVIVVEQGDVKKTQQIVDQYSGHIHIKIVYQNELSLSVARNTGIEIAICDIIVFLDDDMEVASTYIETAVKYLGQNQHVLGLTGHVQKKDSYINVRKIIGIFFGIYSYRATNRVLVSGSYDYIRGKSADRDQSVEWMWGGNMVFRRSIFKHGFQFNKWFKKWSFGEDVMLTYQVYKAFPGSLWYLSDLGVTHHHAVEQKMVPKEVVRMQIIYRYIFWKQEVYMGSWLRLCAYVWSQIGLVGLYMIQLHSLSAVQTIFETYMYVFRHRNVLVKAGGDYNDFIFRKK